MKPSDMMPIEHDRAEMRQLSSNRSTVRMELPALPIEGWPKTLRVKIDFDADTIDHSLRG